MMDLINRLRTAEDHYLETVGAGASVSRSQSEGRTEDRAEAENTMSIKLGIVQEQKQREVKIESMQNALSDLQERVLTMPKKERKAAKAQIVELEDALAETVKGYKSLNASQAETPRDEGLSPLINPNASSESNAAFIHKVRVYLRGHL